jgi:RNA polymerase sigma-70 factor (ECF subfamily)
VCSSDLIARNTLRSHYAKKRPLLSGDEQLQHLMADDPQPEQVVTRQEHQRALQQALLKLNEMQRTIVIVRYIHGFSTKETARILTCSETNVKVQLFRALRKLRQILTEDSEWMFEETIASKEVRSL